MFRRSELYRVVSRLMDHPEEWVFSDHSHNGDSHAFYLFIHTPSKKAFATYAYSGFGVVDPHSGTHRREKDIVFPRFEQYLLFRKARKLAAWHRRKGDRDEQRKRQEATARLAEQLRVSRLICQGPGGSS